MNDQLEQARLMRCRHDWPVYHLKHLARLTGGGTPAKENDAFWEGGDVPWISPKDMKRRVITSAEDYITEDAVDGSATSFVDAGSPLMVVRSGILRHTLPVAIAGRRLTLNQDMKAFNLSSRLNPMFFVYWVEGQSSDLLLEWRQFGATVESIDTGRLLNGRVALPDLPTQKAIADFLDRETARIDQLIEKKQRLISLLQPRWESLFHVGWEDTSKERVRFKFIATRSQRQIRLEETDEFTPLGLYNRGRGYFKKTPSPGHELGDSTFFWVQEGDLILSGQFAWEGAIALAGEDADGCVVSHRYPVYVGTRGVLTAYLYAYFRTVNGQFLLDNCSRGAAGRNRPLNTNILEREKIPLLPRHIQEEVARLVEQERAIKNVVTASIDLLREFRSALITAAVTGEIDVSTWGKQRTIDRRLDQIKEATST